MNLIIDVGNTRVKLAVFNGKECLSKTAVKMHKLVESVQNIQKDHPEIQKGIVSSVGRLDKQTLKTLHSMLDLLELTPNTKVPFVNNYATPKTLGLDRIALVSASVYNFPERDALIIDAGTCITYDFVTHNKEYLGGAISPGLRIRYKALNNLTANLPLLEMEQPHFFIGDSTSSSIHIGVVHGVVNEIDGFIANYLEKYPNLKIILTGGDANFLSKQLKSSIFANSNFILEGLNYILKYNSN